MRLYASETNKGTVRMGVRERERRYIGSHSWECGSSSAIVSLVLRGTFVFRFKQWAYHSQWYFDLSKYSVIRSGFLLSHFYLLTCIRDGLGAKGAVFIDCSCFELNNFQYTRFVYGFACQWIENRKSRHILHLLLHLLDGHWYHVVNTDYQTTTTLQTRTLLRSSNHYCHSDTFSI